MSEKKQTNKKKNGYYKYSFDWGIGKKKIPFPNFHCCGTVFLALPIE